VCFILSDASVNRRRLCIPVAQDLLEREGVNARAIKMSTERMLGAVRIPTASLDARVERSVFEDLGNGITRDSASRAVNILTPAIRIRTQGGSPFTSLRRQARYEEER
jgi:hypothetical protein